MLEGGVGKSDLADAAGGQACDLGEARGGRGAGISHWRTQYVRTDLIVSLEDESLWERRSLRAFTSPFCSHFAAVGGGAFRTCNRSNRMDWPSLARASRTMRERGGGGGGGGGGGLHRRHECQQGGEGGEVLSAVLGRVVGGPL